ncbi:glycosyltransferase [Ramlibacter tataouinensis]|uniref:CgeB family protein n=1 Tax=Ramlibacter tataouinensis TaxID=94132 RepID=UPI0022F3E70D|nr:glycosyltransferase [Ramlibacter tataouinensis]WBY02638.1 glycosyltransferase [Ramlibacter tataouinensis]
MTHRLSIVILGLSITSSWGNGHATTYRALVRELVAAGHEVLFLEREQPWYAANRDLPQPPWGRLGLYGSLDELHDRWAAAVRAADLVIVGSFVPQGAPVGDWVQAQASGIKAFYDIDTPVTLAKLARGEHDYLRPGQVAGYDLYLSFTGGPTLQRLEREFGALRARVLYCSVDPQLYYPEPQPAAWDLGYMGTYSDDRQPGVERLLLQPAREWPQGRFVVAGPQYPDGIAWPANCSWRPHLPPAGHRAFYNRQRFTLNITRADMLRAGWSPSVRLFEAAACGTPLISDRWAGIETLFEPGREIVLADGPADVLAALRGMGEDERLAMAARARRRILEGHTAAHRARELVAHAMDLQLEAAP